MANKKKKTQAERDAIMTDNGVEWFYSKVEQISELVLLESLSKTQHKKNKHYSLGFLKPMNILVTMKNFVHGGIDKTIETSSRLKAR